MTDFLRELRAIIFDFDGTIIDSNEIKLNCFIDLFSDQEFVKNDLIYFISSLGHVDRFNVIRACCEKFFQGKYSEYDIQTKISLYNRKCLRQIVRADEIPYALEFIKTAHAKGYLLFISSATPEKELIKIIKSLKLFHFFNGVFGGPKSKVLHIDFILEQQGLSATEIVYIGDSDIDQVSAARAGCHFIGITSKHSRFSTKPKVSHRGFGDILSNLTGIEGKI